MEGSETVRFGIGMPQVRAGQRTDVEELPRFLARVEELGYDSVWVLEQPIGSAPTLDPISLLAHASALTSRVGLGTAVILLPLRDPVTLAKALATVDQLSGGRLIVGVALGGRSVHYSAFGLSAEGRVRRFEEAIGLLRLLWTERSVTFRGEFWQLDGVQVEPKPLQRPHPPVWFGGGRPAALRRAVAIGDGWIGAGSSSTDEFRGAVAMLREELEARGRNPSSFPLAKRVYIAVDPDREHARTRMREWFASFYGDPDLVDRVAVLGSTDECAQQLAAVAEAGADLIIVNPVFDLEEQAEVLASQVLPLIDGSGGDG